MTDNNRKILLLGGGYSLTHLAKRLDPATFVITTRSEEKKREFEELGFFSVIADIANPSSIKDLFSKCSSLQTIIDSIPPLKEGEPHGGVQNLLSHLPKSVERIIYLGTTGVYGKRDGSWVTEETVCNPISSQSKARMLVEKEYEKSPVPVTTLRLSGIYGPTRGIEKRLKSGKYTQLGDGTRWTNRIHVDDIVGVLEKIIFFKEELPTHLNLSDDTPSEMKEVVDYYCEKFSFDKPQMISIREAEDENRHRLLLNQRVSNELLKKTLEYTFKYPSYREEIF